MAFRGFHRISTTAVALLVSIGFAHAYIDTPPATLGRMCDATMSITAVRIEKVDMDKGLVIFRAIRDLKGNGPSDVVKHVVGGKRGEGQQIIASAKEGKQAIHFASASRNYSYTYIDRQWYSCGLAEGWWRLVRTEPDLLRCNCGTVDDLIAAVGEIVAGKEVVVTALDKEQKQQRIRASLKRLD